MTKNGALIDGIFTGATINTPSMVCVEDYLDALQWVESLGGVDAAIQRSKSNLAVRGVRARSARILIISLKY